MKRVILGLLLAGATACGGEAADEETGAAAAAPALRASPADTADVTATVAGLSGPEAVRHDPEQDVWLVANFGAGEGDPRDGDGFIARLTAEGEVDSLRFMVGTAGAPLHMPRGMFIEGDTLWVADVDGVHGFHRRDGRQLAFIDFTMHEPGFLNDVAAGPDGVLYVTDTGRARVYRVAGAGGRPEVVVDSLPAPPNGITWDRSRGAFLLAPWGDGRVILSLTPDGAVDSVATVETTRFDGIEMVGDRILVATQADSSLWLVERGTPVRVVRVRGRPADIAYDARRGVVAVPYIALNRVDFWEVR